MASTVDVLKATQEKWVKALSDETIDLNPISAMLKAKGLIEMNCAGEKVAWTVKKKQLSLTGYGPMDQLSFDVSQLHEKAELPWRGYKMKDALPEQALRENAGQEAVVKLFTNKLESMREDALDQFNKEFYVDGNATGNEKRFHGIESFMSTDTQTAGDAYATTLNDTYAGLNTVHGDKGGSDRTDPEFDYFSPVIVHSDQTGKSWAADADELLRRGFIRARYGKAKTQRVDLVMCTEDDYLALVDLLMAKETLNFSRGQADGVARFGFDALSFDGVDVMYDPDLPSSANTRAYGFTISQMKLCILGGGSLWNASGSTFNEDTMSFRYWVGTYGNFIFKSPRHFVSWKDMA